MNIKRITNEWEQLQSNPIPYISAGPKMIFNMTEWIATIIGPESTPYEGGIFNLEIKFPVEYPFKPPKITFITKVYHCNINNSGGICLDLLKDSWSPAINISKLLLCICSLLAEPNPNDPLVPEIAELYKNNRILHDEIAKNHTIEYANN